MNDGNSILSRLEKWQKGFLVVIVDVPSAILVVSLISSIFIPTASQPLLLPGYVIFLFIFGILGGYFAENEYFKTFVFSILTIFLFSVFIASIAILFGEGIFGFSRSADPIGSIFITLIFTTMFGFVVLFSSSIFLYPALFIGSLIAREIGRNSNQNIE